MKIFITGATGFVGSHLVRRLTETNHKPICLVRATSDVSEFLGENTKLVYGDVRARDSILRGMLDCQCVVNMANVYSFWEPNPQIYYDVNVEGTRNVMECALEAKVSHVIHLSTYGAYGTPEDCPFTEESIPGPVRSCEYAESKYQADKIVWDLYESQDLPVTVIYPANILGPGDDKATSRYIKNIIYRRYPARVLERHYLTCVHLRDVVEAILAVMNQRECIGEKYLIGKQYFTFRDFNRMISDETGVPLPRLTLPDTFVVWMAAILTFFSDILKKPPLFDLSNDQVRAMMSDARCNGLKAERELGITYSPIRLAISEAIESFSD